MRKPYLERLKDGVLLFDGAMATYLFSQVYNAYNRFLGTWSDAADFHKAIDDLALLATRSLPWPDLRQRILFTEAMVWWNALGDELKAKETFWQVRALGAETPVGQKATELLDHLP